MIIYSLLSFLLIAGTNAAGIESRIINGEDVAAGMYPWFARADTCGASLISAEYILTAGTCMHNIVSFSFSVCSRYYLCLTNIQFYLYPSQ